MNKLRRRSPLLGKGGVAAPSAKYREATLAGADGVVRSTDSLLDQHHPACALTRLLRDIFLTAQPPLLSYFLS